MVALLYSHKLTVHQSQSATHPRMRVPVVILLTLHLRKVSQPLHHLVVFQVLDVLETQQNLVRSQSVPMNPRRIIHDSVSLSEFLWDIAMPD